MGGHLFERWAYPQFAGEAELLGEEAKGENEDSFVFGLEGEANTPCLPHTVSPTHSHSHSPTNSGVAPSQQQRSPPTHTRAQDSLPPPPFSPKLEGGRQ